MSFTDHPGFLASVAESAMTARQAIAFVSAVEALEGSIAGSALSGTDADPVRQPWPLGQERNPIILDRLVLVQCASCGFLRTLPSLSENSSSDPLHEMTAGEIMRASENGVQR